MVPGRSDIGGPGARLRYRAPMPVRGPPC